MQQKTIRILFNCRIDLMLEFKTQKTCVQWKKMFIAVGNACRPAVQIALSDIVFIWAHFCPEKLFTSDIVTVLTKEVSNERDCKREIEKSNVIS
jgi:hypothetical protein